MKCRRCELLFRRTPPSPAEVPAIYGDEYFRLRPGAPGVHGYLDYLADEEIHRLGARKRLGLLARAVAPGRLLDVGAAAGLFMDEARRRGWGVEGVDVAPSMGRWARQELGLEVATGLFAEVDLANHAYDCVTMWDYLEHSIDAAADLARAHRLLRDGGVIALSTGDAGSIVARAFGRRWHLLTPRHHNFFFTRPTLARLLARAGFEEIWMGHPSAPYSLRYCLYKLGTMAPDDPRVASVFERLASRRLARVVLPVNLGDVVTVTARKSSADRSSTRARPPSP